MSLVTRRRSTVLGASAAAVALTAILLWATSRPNPSEAGPPGDAATFVTRIVGLVVEDKYARAWESLHPAHQLAASSREYVVCELKSPIGGKLRAADVVRVREILVRVPGEPERVPATAVTLRIRIYQPSLRSEETFTETFNAVASGSRWTWILTPARYETYATDTC